MAFAPRQVLTIPLTAGLNTKGDRRAQDAPLLDIAVDIEFDDVGGLRTRYPFGAPLALLTQILGVPVAIANPRKLAVRGSELLLFSDTALWSWSESAGYWRLRGTYLAAMTDEETVFAISGDQTCVSRIVQNGVEVWAWLNDGSIWFGARDVATGHIVSAPTLNATLSAAGPQIQQLRLVAINGFVLCSFLTTTTNYTPGESPPATVRVHIAPITASSSGLVFYSTLFVDLPGAASIPPETMAGVGYYDIVARPDGLAAVVVGNRLNETLVIAQVTSTTVYAVAGVTSIGYPAPICASVSDDRKLLIVYQRNRNGFADRVADLWTLGALPATAPTQIFNQFEIATDIIALTGNPAAHFTAAWLPKSGTTQTAIVWGTLINLTDGEGTGIPFPTFQSRLSYVDGAPSGTVVAEPPFAASILPAARPWIGADGHAYCAGAFAGFAEEGSGWTKTGTHSQTQNAFYLYRDDGLLVARACDGNGAGFYDPGWVAEPIVVDATHVAVPLSIREIFNVLVNDPSDPNRSIPDYGMRAPQLVTFSFDDDRARRTVQLGNTLYISGSLPQTYDGVSLSECGFPVYPWALALATESSDGSMTASAGYSYKYTLRKQNAANETDRSTTATTGLVTLGASDKGVNLTLYSTSITSKPNVALEVWRTAANPPPGAEYFLCSSRDPSVTGANGYVANDPTSANAITFDDRLSDDALTANEEDPLTTDGNVEFLAPASCSIMATDDTRIYLAGVPNEPNNVYYSRQRNPGEVVAFNDILQFAVPPHGGPITALAWLDGMLVVFCATATYQFAGTGIDNNGGLDNQFTLAKVLSYDLGAVNQDAVVPFDDGLLVKTAKGWYVLGRDTNFAYAGAGVYKYDDEAVLSTEILPARHQIRIVTTGRVLMFDTLVKHWATWSVVGLDSVLWNGQHVVLTTTGPRVEQSTYDGVDYGFDVELSWIKPADQQGRAIVDYFDVLGEYRSAFAMRVRIARDYQGDGAGGWSYHTDRYWAPYPAAARSALQFRASPSSGYNRCESIKIRLTAYAPDQASPPTGPCARLTSIALQWAPEPGLYNNLANAQKL